MNARQVKLLAVVLGVLVLAVVIKRFLPRTELSREEAESLSVPIAIGSADRIVIAKGTQGATVELSRADGTWRLPSLWNAKADEEKVTQWLKELSTLKGELRGDSESLFGDFGIADDAAFHVSAFAKEQELTHLLIGTKRMGWQDLFLRRAGSANVFVVQSSLTSTMGLYGELEAAEPKADVWLDLRLFTMEPSSVEAVEIQEGQAEWRTIGEALPFDRDDQKRANELQGLVNLRASGVVDPAGSGYGFDAPAWQLRLTRKEGTPIVVTVGALKSGSTTDRSVKLDGVQEIYTVSSSTLDRLKMDGSRWIREDPLKVVGMTAGTLTVEVPGKQVTRSLTDERSEGLTQYLDSLKTFRVSQADHLPPRTDASAPLTHRLTLQGETQGETPAESLTIACEAPKDAEANTISCVNERNQLPFLIERYTFTSVFEGLERLDQPLLPPPAEPAPALPEVSPTQAAPADPTAVSAPPASPQAAEPLSSSPAQ